VAVARTLARPSSAAGPRSPDRKQCLRLGRGQACQPGAEAAEELVATRVSGVTVQRHPGCAQGVDIAVDRADADLKLRGKFLRGHPAARLQQQQQGEQPARAHGSILPTSTDRRCQRTRPSLTTWQVAADASKQRKDAK
jgi:hypothetical protein